MRITNAGSRQRLQIAVAVCLAFWVVAVGAEWALPGLDPALQHGPHGLVTSPVDAIAPVAIEHPHLSTGSSDSPEISAEAVLPRGAVALAALGIVAAALVMLASGGRDSSALVRGPPRRIASVLTGRDMLTRLCISRR